MDAASIMHKWAGPQGWDADTQLDLALQYIDNQLSGDAFHDFLAQVARAENEWAYEGT